MTALHQSDERSKRSQRFTIGLLVLAVATSYVVHWLHPKWTFHALAALFFK